VGEDKANGIAGGSATMAVDVLKSRGVPENRILFLNLIASPEGIDGFAKRFPKLRVVTAFIDAVRQTPRMLALITDS
jgi:uracil phosphoribosyltransferase